MNQLIVRLCVITAIILAASAISNGQNGLPEELKQGTIPEQLKYLDEHTRIYENYRAIREDMFRSLSRNTMDTLAKAKNKINQLNAQTTTLDNRIDSLQNSLEASRSEMLKATRTKNSIGVLGIEVGKVLYNTVMWSILGALVFLLIVGFLTFRQNRAVTLRTKKDLEELKAEYEEYRTRTRLEREKLAIEHFNEIKKLKGKI